MERARCVQIFVDLSKQLWVGSVNTACSIVNISPSTVIYSKTPQKVWSRKPSDYYGLHISGCPAYAHLNDGKLESRAMECIFIGYATGVKGHRLCVG